MEKDSKIYIAGHLGMVGSAIVRALKKNGYHNIIGKSIDELDLTNQLAVNDFFHKEMPEYVFLAAAKVGGILANNTYRAQFIFENLMIQNNIIHQSYLSGVKKLLFLGSSCIYPRNCPQPMKEEFLLTGELEYTNEPYAIAKIAGIKMCENYYHQYGSNFISVMPTNLYGPNDNYNLETSHVLPAIIRKMHLGKCLENNDWPAIRRDLDTRPIEGINGTAPDEKILTILEKYGIRKEADKDAAMPASTGLQPVTITLWGTGKVYREFMHVDDMAAACLYCMENINADDFSGIFERRTEIRSAIPFFLNIGTGEDSTVFETAFLIKKIIGFQGQISWDSSKPDGTPKKLLDISRLHCAGFISRYKLEEGIRMVYDAYAKT